MMRLSGTRPSVPLRREGRGVLKGDDGLIGVWPKSSRVPGSQRPAPTTSNDRSLPGGTFFVNSGTMVECIVQPLLYLSDLVKGISKGEADLCCIPSAAELPGEDRRFLADSPQGHFVSGAMGEKGATVAGMTFVS
jgi:hypothetical protein